MFYNQFNMQLGLHDPEAHLNRLVDVLNKYSAAIEQGTVITIDPNKTRLHILPFVIPDKKEI